MAAHPTEENFGTVSEAVGKRFSIIMPFPGCEGVIPCFAHHLRPDYQVPVNVLHTTAEQIRARQDSRAAWHADCTYKGTHDVCLSEGSAARHERIQRWGFHGCIAHATDGIPPMVISDYKKNIGA